MKGNITDASFLVLEAPSGGSSIVMYTLGSVNIVVKRDEVALFTVLK